MSGCILCRRFKIHRRSPKPPLPPLSGKGAELCGWTSPESSVKFSIAVDAWMDSRRAAGNQLSSLSQQPRAQGSDSDVGLRPEDLPMSQLKTSPQDNNHALRRWTTTAHEKEINHLQTYEGPNKYFKFCIYHRPRQLASTSHDTETIIITIISHTHLPTPTPSKDNTINSSSPTAHPMGL